MAGLNAFGVAFARGDGAAPEVFTPIAHVTSVSGPGLSRNTIDVTTHQSPGAWMEFIGGLKDGGEVSIDVNYDPSDHDALVADFNDPDPRSYRLLFPDPAQTTWTLRSILTGFEPSAPVDDKLSAALTFKVSGAPVLA
ncbi:phage tail tube protein [Streptomyces sp. NPDC006798]|uniref:phage tail tube protein n=1 Tax=Streptomyces sp. NPDC006798 TaxID=3155462 RepID=UPI0033D18C1B